MIFSRLLLPRLLLPLCALILIEPASSHAKTDPADAGSRAVILVFGDSLSAEYGLARGTGWVALLAERLAASHPGYRIVNASVSGETTHGGATRLPALLAEHRPAIVILELGGNDALRGLSLDSVESNLDAMIRVARHAKAQVLVVGMQIPPNYGRAYAERFRDLFGPIAERHGAALTPFLLAGIADDASRFQSDRIHPNESAQPMLLENVWLGLVPLL